MIRNSWRFFLKSATMLSLVLMAFNSFAVTDLGGLSSQIYSNFSNLSKLITAASYIAGLGFAIASIMKFKAHKDNPTQVQIGTPVALVMVASALLFLPSILDTTGYTLFSDGGTVAGPTGDVWAPSTFGGEEVAAPTTTTTPTP